MKERLVIVFIAVILGLLISTAGFFIYQSTQSFSKPESKEQTLASTTEKKPDTTPTPASGLFITLDTPENESIHDKRTIEIKGKTNAGNFVVISSNQEDVYAEPSANGAFSTTITIDAGPNKIITRAISEDGEVAVDERMVTYVSEDF